MYCTRPTPLESTAHHEASHALAAVLFNIPFRYVKLSLYHYLPSSDENLGGIVLYEPHRKFDPNNAAHRLEAENWVVFALAGEAGEAYREGRRCDILRGSAADDYKIAIKVAEGLHDDPVARAAFMEGQTRTACKLVSDPLHDRQIAAVASNLRVLMEMSYDSVVGIMEAMKNAIESNPGCDNEDDDENWGDAG